MKTSIYCLQNELIEKILTEKKILDKGSIILRKPEEIKLSLLDKIKPDFIFFPHWSHKVPSEVVNKYKCICFHSSPLPYGRGGSPIQNMILRDHTTSEVCSLLMVEDFDAGPIYLRDGVSLDGTLDEILLRIYNIIGEQIKILIKEEIEPKKQKGSPTVFKRLSHEDNEILPDSNLLSLFNKIRMLDSQLYPKAFIDYGNFKLEFTDAKLSKNQIDAKVVFKFGSEKKD